MGPYFSAQHINNVYGKVSKCYYIENKLSSFAFKFLTFIFESNHTGKSRESRVFFPKENLNDLKFKKLYLSVNNYKKKIKNKALAKPR